MTVLFAHSWEEDFADYFREALRFIREKGLPVLDRQGFLKHLAENRPFPARSVLITLDDGALQDEEALCLLEEYDLPAVSFVIPNPCVPERYYRQPENWKMWARMERGGRVAVEAHSMTHARVFSSPRVADFVLDPPEGINILGLDPRPGTPVLETGPALVSRRYFPPVHLMDRCADHYARTLADQSLPAGERKEALRSFLVQGGWAEPGAGSGTTAMAPARLELKGGTWESREEFHERVYRDVTLSKELLERRLGKQILLFAYPFGAVTEELAGLVRRAGYAAAFTTRPEPFRVEEDRFRIGRFEMKRFSLWQESCL